MCCARVKFRTADEAVKEKVLNMSNVGSGVLKSNTSAKLVGLIEDKILEVQALCAALSSMSVCGWITVRRSKSLLLKMLGDCFVVEYCEVLVGRSVGLAVVF